jgi:hypothetical protein
MAGRQARWMSPVPGRVEAIRHGAGALSASLPCVVTTSAGTLRMRARLMCRPSDPELVAAAMSDRSGVVRIWLLGRGLLEAGLTAPASKPARRNRIWVWTSEGPAGRSLMVARASPFFEVLELDCAVVGAFLAGRVRAEETVVVRR